MRPRVRSNAFPVHAIRRWGSSSELSLTRNPARQTVYAASSATAAT